MPLSVGLGAFTKHSVAVGRSAGALTHCGAAEFRWVLFVCFSVVLNSTSASSEMSSCISHTFIFFISH